MTEFEMLQDEFRQLELRVLALEQAVRVLQGHLPDEVMASDFNALWATLVHTCPPNRWGELRGLYQRVVEQWAPDGIDSVRAWLNGSLDEFGGSRPIDLIRQGKIREVEEALLADIRSVVAS